MTDSPAPLKLCSLDSRTFAHYVNLNMRAGLWFENSPGKSFFFFFLFLSSHFQCLFNMGGFPCCSVGSFISRAHSCPGDVAQLDRRLSVRFSTLTGREALSPLSCALPLSRGLEKRSSRLLGFSMFPWGESQFPHPVRVPAFPSFFGL